MADSHMQYRPDQVSPPGETLQELLEERGISQRELAARMGRPIKTINEIVNGKAQVTPDTSLQLERALGLPAAFWNEREAHYRGYLAKADADRRAVRWLTWLDELPLKDMMAAGVIPTRRNTEANRLDLLDAALKFFGVASPDEWKYVYAKPQAAYRRTREEQSHRGAVAAWLRMGEIEARQSDCEPFDAERFMKSLTYIRQLTVDPPENFQAKITELCASAGVVLAFVPAIPRAHVSGAARWINRRAVIQLSLYGKTNDRFWFTFFHEAGHILLHGKDEVFLDDISSKSMASKYEHEANRFSSEALIPQQYWGRLRMLVDEQSIVKFARELGIHPGIVVGRLQHEDLVPFNTTLNYLKTSFEWVR